MSVPDLELEGHTNLAEFALGVSSAEPLVASGGRDTNVRRQRVASVTGDEFEAIDLRGHARTEHLLFDV
jgi:hypothetical protein